jgi:hypothetical protein
MTEYIIVYKPRGRPVNYPYKQYKLIGAPQSNSFSIGGVDIRGGTGTNVPLYSGSTTFVAQQFTAPPLGSGVSEVRFGGVSFVVYRTGSPSGTATVTLRADSSNRPGSSIGTIGSFNVSTISTSGTVLDLVSPSPGFLLTSGTKYWVVLNYGGGNSSNYISIHRATTDAYTDHLFATSTNGTSWTTDANDWRIGVRFRYYYTYSFSFPYSSAFNSEKRLQHSLSNIISENIKVNGTNITPPLSKERTIPQATNYTIEGLYLQSIYVNGSTYATITTTPYFYFMDPDISIEDLGASEAYLLRVVFSENGSILRVNDLTDSDLYGDAGQALDFADLAIPVRRLKWIVGSGECTLLVID